MSGHSPSGSISRTKRNRRCLLLTHNIIIKSIIPIVHESITKPDPLATRTSSIGSLSREDGVNSVGMITSPLRCLLVGRITLLLFRRFSSTDSLGVFLINSLPPLVDMPLKMCSIPLYQRVILPSHSLVEFTLILTPTNCKHVQITGISAAAFFCHGPGCISLLASISVSGEKRRSSGATGGRRRGSAIGSAIGSIFFYPSIIQRCRQRSNTHHNIILIIRIHRIRLSLHIWHLH
mmetsp:Transcript_15038/g.22652  ORF Transcript_15038/g.22652 Transcript_15038/m.22652 type:complete len:235 (-) Transcript_15038:1784-2488(-)